MRDRSAIRRCRGIRPAALVAAAAMAWAQTAQAQTGSLAAQGYEIYQHGVPGKPACASCHGPDPETSIHPLGKARGNPAYLPTAWSMPPMKQYDFAASIDEAGRNAIAQYLLYPAAGNQPYSQFSLQSIAFGDVAIGHAQRKVLTLTNIGAQPLVGIALQASPSAVGVTASDDCPSGGLPPGASCTVTVTFDPRAVGAASAVYLLRANQDASTSSQFVVAGNGVDAAAPAPDASASAGGGGSMSLAALGGLVLAALARLTARRRPR